jgi:hypothetical protein
VGADVRANEHIWEKRSSSSLRWTYDQEGERSSACGTVYLNGLKHIAKMI